MNLLTARKGEIYAGVVLATASGLAISFLEDSLIRSVFGLSLSLFLPIHSIFVAAFPGSGLIDLTRTIDADAQEATPSLSFRVPLAIILGLGFSALMGAVLSLSPLRLERQAFLWLTTTFLLVMYAIALIRVQREPDHQPETVTVSSVPRKLVALLRANRTAVLITSLATLILLGSIGMLMSTDLEEGYTELYLLDHQGDPIDSLDPKKGEELNITLALRNQEGTTIAYELQISVVNLTTINGSDSARRADADTLERDIVNLDSGEEARKKFSYSFNSSGKRLLLFDLYRPGEPTSPYRSVHLNVTIQGEAN